MALREKEKDRHGGKRGAVGATHTYTHTLTLRDTGWGTENPALLATFYAQFVYVAVFYI